VISPSSVRTDRKTKRAFYLRAGVAEYWVVDIEARRVERWRPGYVEPEVLFARLQWSPSGSIAPLIIDLEAFFSRVEAVTG
jgi:Uma2 family endonuclease